MWQCLAPQEGQARESERTTPLAPLELEWGEPLQPEAHARAQQLLWFQALPVSQEKEPSTSYTIAGKETEVFVSVSEAETGLCTGA